MEREKFNSHAVCTSRQYAIGQHYRWEAAVHTAGEEFKKTHNRQWTWTERASFVDDYLSRTPYAQQMAVVTCAVCSAVIADAILEGRDPFAIPEAVKNKLAELKVRVSMPDSYRYKKSKRF